MISADMAKRSNCKPAKGVSTGKMTKAAWVAFDALPRDLRRALWESPVPINPVSVAAALEQSRPIHVLSRIRQSVRDEIELYSEEHRRRYGRELPHVAAEATVQRYNAKLY
jgi:hypothetical protein